MTKYNDKTKIKELLADPAAVAVVEKYLGSEILKNPLLTVARDYTVGVAMKYSGMTNIPQQTIYAIYNEIMMLE